MQNRRSWKVASLILLIVILASSVVMSSCATQPATPAPATKPAQPQAAEKPIELTFSTWTPVVACDTERDEAWIKEVEQRTNGRVKFTLYKAAALGKSADHYDMAVNDVANLTFYNLSSTQGRFPLAETMEIPFTIPSTQVGSKVVVQLYREFPELQKELKDVKVIGMGVNDPYYPHTAKSAKPLRTLDDFRGLKMRTSGSEGDTIKALGAAPTGMPTSELYLALQRGVVDGASMGYQGIKSFKLNEVLYNYTYWDGSSLRVSPWVIAMNLKKWNSLPPDIQKIMSKDLGIEGDWYAPWAAGFFDKWEADCKKLIKDLNQDLYKVPADEVQKWSAAVAPVRDNWIKNLESKGLPGNKFYNRMLELVKQFNK